MCCGINVNIYNVKFELKYLLQKSTKKIYKLQNFNLILLRRHLWWKMWILRLSSITSCVMIKHKMFNLFSRRCWAQFTSKLLRTIDYFARNKILPAEYTNLFLIFGLNTKCIFKHLFQRPYLKILLRYDNMESNNDGFLSSSVLCVL